MTARSRIIIVVSSSLSLSLLVLATGGLRSPLTALTFAALFAASLFVPASRIWIPAAFFSALFLFDFLRTAVAAPQSAYGAAAMLASIIASQSFSAAASAALRRRHERAESGLRESNDNLTKLLAESDEEKRWHEAAESEQKALNAEHIEMRSALMNLLEDIGESKREIESAHLRDAAIFTAMGEGLVAADKSGKIFLFNPAASAIIGIPHLEAVGKPIETVVRFFEEGEAVMRTKDITDAFAGKGEKLPSKLTVSAADGRRVPVSGSAGHFSDAGGKVQGIVIAFRDVTIERDIDRQKSGFIAIASHQLRTPLSTIRWFVDLLLAGDAGRLQAKQREFLQDIYSSVTRMINLVGDLLNVSRIESKKLVVDPRPTDLVVLLAETLKDYEVPFRNKKLKPRAVFPPKGKAVVTIDPGSIRQAVANLLSNAVNYTPEGGEVGVRVMLEGREAVIEVWDTGIGIPESQKHRVYERFFRADNAVSRETVGSGLGLYIVRLIVEASGGSISFESEENKGTRFYIRLPLTAEGKGA